MSRWVIGDIQGCLTALQNLLDVLAFHPDHDELFLCGDLINRGPDSLATLRYLHARRDNVKLLLGNHDLHALAVLQGVRPLKQSDTFGDWLQAPDREILADWLLTGNLCLWDEATRSFLSHAGLPPQWTVQTALSVANCTLMNLRRNPVSFFEQMYGNHPADWRLAISSTEQQRYAINALTRMRFVDQHGALELTLKCSPTQAPTGITPWFCFPATETATHTVIFGHWAALAGHTGSLQFQALDTGCVYGGQLTAYNLDTGVRHSVNGWHSTDTFTED